MKECDLTDLERNKHIQAYNHALFENMSYFMDAVWEMNLDERSVYVLYDKFNPVIRGTVMDMEMLEDFLCSSVHTDDIANLTRMMSCEYLSKLTKTETYTSQSLVDGQFRTIQGVATPCRGSDGKVHEVYFSFRDIQEEIDEEKRFAVSIDNTVHNVENQVANTLEGAKIGMWKMIIEPGKAPALYLDAMAAKLVGAPSYLSPDETFAFLNERIDTGSKWRADLYLKNMLAGKNDEVIYPYYHPTLGTLSIRCGGRLDTSYEGPGVLLRGYHQDISEHEEEIRSLNEELNRYLSAVNCGITQYSVDMKHILFVNDIALKTLGYESREEMEKDLVGGVVGNVPKKEAKRIRMISSKIKSPRDVADYEFHLTHKDGRELTCFGSIRMIERPGEEPIIQRSIIDISEARNTQRLYTETKDAYDELKRYQDALKEALTKAEVANRSKTVFLSNMSHDIRTPMNAIIGFTELALSRIDDREKVAYYLKKIQASSNHLIDLINDVLIMSHIDSGKLELQESEVSLKELIGSVADLVSGEVNKKGQNLFVDCEGIMDDNVWCDKVRLNRVLINCLSNSVKFTPDGGSIGIKVSEYINALGENVYTFTVSDTGIGMSQAFLERVFEPFERERSSTVSGITGTGLGMTISKKIVEMMGGSIEISSEPGKGTVVRISLKLRNSEDQKYFEEQEEKSKESKESETDECNIRGVRVLLVEDNELNREIATEILEDKGVVVTCAEDGKKACDMLAATKPGDIELILMDIQMPVMDGYEATRVIRQMEREDLSKLPIIAMTANAFDEDKKKAFDAGMDAHLAKPIIIDELFEAISKHVRKE